MLLKELQKQEVWSSSRGSSLVKVGGRHLQQHNYQSTPSSTGTPTTIPVETGQRPVQNKNPQSRTNKEASVFQQRPAAESAVGKTLNRNTDCCSSLGCQTNRCPNEGHQENIGPDQSEDTTGRKQI